MRVKGEIIVDHLVDFFHGWVVQFTVNDIYLIYSVPCLLRRSRNTKMELSRCIQLSFGGKF